MHEGTDIPKTPDLAPQGGKKSGVSGQMIELYAAGQLLKISWDDLLTPNNWFADDVPDRDPGRTQR